MSGSSVTISHDDTEGWLINELLNTGYIIES